MSRDHRLYTTHDSISRNDPKIIMLRTHHGWKGYGLWWAIVEVLIEQTNYRLPREDGLAILATAIGCSRDELAPVAQEALDRGLLQADDEWMWSESLNYRMVNRDAAKDKALKASMAASLSRSSKDSGNGSFKDSPKDTSKDSPKGTQVVRSLDSSKDRGYVAKHAPQSIIKDARPAPQPTAVHREPAPARDKYGKVIPLSTPGGGPLLRNFGGEPILYPRFDLMIEGESHSYPENRVKPPPHDPGEGKKWCWRPEALCWYVDIIDDKKNFTYGVPTVKYERMSFREQEKLELESEGSMYYDAAMNCYYSESSRRTKAREDANGTTERDEAADAAAVKERFAKIKADNDARKAEQAKLATPGKARKFFK